MQTQLTTPTSIRRRGLEPPPTQPPLTFAALATEAGPDALIRCDLQLASHPEETTCQYSTNSRTRSPSAAEHGRPRVVGLGRGWGRGSGVVTAAGTVLTNAHVLRGEEVAVTFADGRTEHGRVAGADPDLDLAAISVDTGDTTPVTWDPDRADATTIGTPVFALANPGGRGLRTTFGLVSATGRSFRGPRGRRIGGSIEHTAPLPRGSSGGPLVDAEGRLLGLNSIRVEGGLILALPADAAMRRRAEALAAGTGAERPRLGIAHRSPARRQAHARRRRPARARRAARARGGGGQPGRARRARARGPARRDRPPAVDLRR